MLLNTLVSKLSFLHDLLDYKRLLQSKSALVLISLTLGLTATLGFAPYNMWVITAVSLIFELYYLATQKSAKRVFCSLLLYFTALNAITLEWLNFVMNGFGALPLPLSWAIEIIFAAYLSIFHALFGTIAYRLSWRLLKDKLTAASAGAAAAAPAAATTAAAAVDAPAPAAPAPAPAGESDKGDDGGDDEDEDDDYDAMPQRGIGALKAEMADIADKTELEPPEPSKAEQIAALDSIRPDLPGGMPGMFSNALSFPVKTNDKGQKYRFYKQVYLLCFLPVALLLADFLIGYLFTGFPWMYLGYIATEGPFSSYAPLFGVRGITLTLLVCVGALALTLERRFIYLPIAASIFLVGIFTLDIRYTSDLPAIKVAGVQGNIPQSIKWDPLQTMPTIEKYLSLTMEYFGQSDLIVWPESALPIFAQQITPLLSDINIHAEATGSPILVGIQRYEIQKRVQGVATVKDSASSDVASNKQSPSPDELVVTDSTEVASVQNSAEHDDKTKIAKASTTSPATGSDMSADSSNQDARAIKAAPRAAVQRLARRSFNSLFLLGQSENFDEIQIYDKRKLVPFGEVVPFAKYTRALGSIFNFPMSSFTPGSDEQKQMHLLKSNLYFIPAICYESIFPEALAKMHDDNTNGIIMVSNDSWFGHTRGPEEHLSIARMRTMEMQKPMLRITNSGISALIDPLGNIVTRLPQDEAAVLYTDLTPTKGSTPYMKWGNIPLYIALVLLVLIGIYLRQKDEDLQEQHFQELVRP